MSSLEIIQILPQIYHNNSEKSFCKNKTTYDLLKTVANKIMKS